MRRVFCEGLCTLEIAGNLSPVLLGEDILVYPETIVIGYTNRSQAGDGTHIDLVYTYEPCLSGCFLRVCTKHGWPGMAWPLLASQKT